MSSRKFKVLALVEAQVVTAPARILLNFARDSRETVDMRLVTFARSREENAFMAAACDSGVPLEAIPESGRFDRSAIGKLGEICRRLRPDLVQTNSVKSHFLTSLVRPRTFGWLAFHHGYTAEDVKMKLYNQLDRFSLRACDRVVTVCEAFANQLRGQGIARDKITVIPNGLAPGFIERDTAAANATRLRFGIGDGEAVVLSIGRLSSEKGHRYLIEAAAHLKSAESVPAMKILIAGDGLLAETLAAQIEVAGVKDWVQLIGHQSDVRPLFAIADIFVLPSLSEGSPMVLLESMAARVPILATNVGGIPEMLTEGVSARLVPAASPHSLAHTISELLHSPERARALADAAFERLQADFSPARYNQRVLTAFEAVLAARDSKLASAPVAS